ncbi:MAG: Txe/YoeB family addiction module toxin, partial [Bdellovibrionales bacterium]
MYQLHFTKQAQKDSLKLRQAGFKERAQKLLTLLEANPWQNPPPYEKLVGDFSGCCFRRINIQHRLVYEVFEDSKFVKVLRMWTHYE